MVTASVGGQATAVDWPARLLKTELSSQAELGDGPTTASVAGDMTAADPNSLLATAGEVSAYDLGSFTLNQQDVPDAWKSMPVPLRGYLALPAGSGPFPVVVLLHGRHTGCHFAPQWSESRWPCPPDGETRFDQGFAYLAAALAAQGYLALTIDLNGAFAFAYGATPDNYNRLAAQRSPQIVNAHLSRLAAAHRGEPVDFGVSLAGKADFSRLVLIGHSMGGGAAVFSGQQRQGKIRPDQIQSGLGQVSGLLLLAPTPSQAIADTFAAYNLPNVPVSVLLGGCDRDIYDFSSLYYFETAAQQSNRRHFASSVLIPGANHNFFSRALVEDDYERQPDNQPLCESAASTRLSRAAQETFLLDYTLAFLQAVFAPSDGSRVAANPTQPAPRTLFGTPVLTNLLSPEAQRRSLLTLLLTNPSNHLTAALPDWLQPSPELTVQVCPALQACGPYWRPQPLFPALLRLSWQQSSQLRVTLPSSEQNLQDFDSLQMRVAVDVTDALNDAQAQSFALVLQDRQGHAARVEIPATTPALRRYPPDPRWGYQGVPVYPTAVRVPLAQFEGVDLSAIASVTLVFDQSERGVLYLA
ncbi:MAG TPA: hypothetical protein V6D06_05080, partial [Trichocoleus sp.]